MRENASWSLSYLFVDNPKFFCELSLTYELEYLDNMSKVCFWSQNSLACFVCIWLTENEDSLVLKGEFMCDLSLDSYKITSNLPSTAGDFFIKDRIKCDSF